MCKKRMASNNNGNFRNYQWGAEKEIDTWFDDNFIGTELDPELSYAKVANACGLKGVTVKTMEETTKAITVMRRSK